MGEALHNFYMHQEWCSRQNGRYENQERLFCQSGNGSWSSTILLPELVMTRRLLLVTIALIILSGLLSIASYVAIPIPGILLVSFRWIAIGAFGLYAFARRSLTTWIFFAMLAGAALGHDWPQAAINLRVLGQIFLRLIKTIIAPLLFATLVSGI